VEEVLKISDNFKLGAELSAPGCHPQGVFQFKKLQAQNVNLGIESLSLE